jgi:hypothetical protein
MAAPGWMVQRDAITLGPFTVQELRQHIGHGRVRPDDRVRRTDSDTWIAARQVDVLANAFLPNTPTPPPPLALSQSSEPP